MKTQNILLGLICFIILSTMFSSCDKYLDKKEDEPLTFDKIWTKRDNIEKYYGTVWSHIKKDDDIEDGHPFIAAVDDVHLAYNRGYRSINNGTWSPSNVPYINNMWSQFYKGIREANIFLQNVDRSTATNVTPEDIAKWKAEIRFVRAYLTFCLVRTYGPVILVHDEIVDFQQARFNMPRNTLDECFEYIVSELTEIANELPDRIQISDSENLGKPTKGACLALIGRTKLYAARKLFNGNPLYSGVANLDGSKLFPTEDLSKWKAAADANWALINHSETNGNIYKLQDNGNPYRSYQDVFVDNWNDELIFAKYGNRYDLQVLLTPAAVGGTAYGGAGPTQGMVDAYAMSNGRYPITGYVGDGYPIIDLESGYSETGFTQFTHPLDGANGALSTFNMYLNREPRFYASVLWSGAWWPYSSNRKNPVYAYDGNSGPGPRHDYPPTGYMTRKFINPSSNSAGGTWGPITWPVIRLAEIYLNYVEALNESDPSNPNLFTYINKVRTRAGMPNIEDVYPEVRGGANPTKMRELIRRERQVELFFETHRYFDTRQWMIAEETHNGPVYGMNIMARATNVNITPEDFWRRSVSETRIFEPKHYLYPMHQVEMDRNSGLVQNYGW